MLSLTFNITNIGYFSNKKNEEIIKNSDKSLDRNNEK
jgi:hypothetical protein